MQHPARRALDHPTDEVGDALLEPDEDQWFDRKSARTKPPQLAELICAFANAEGGLAALGLHDGQVEGIRTLGNENGWRQANLDFVEPPALVHARTIPCINSSGQPDQLMVIEVEPSERLHRTHRDEVYLRVGDETRSLSFEQRQELAFDKGESKYEVAPCRLLTTVDVVAELVTELARSIGEDDDTPLLQARGLLRDGRLTVAGALLFTDNPQREFPEAHLRVVRYRGGARQLGSRQNIVADRRFEGPLTRQIQAATDAVTDLLPTRRALGESGRFMTVPAIPRDAWLEGIVNAVTHRSYSLSGDHTRVEVFDDRIEIRSPGRFPGVVDLDQPERISRYARNPRIARVLADLDYGQELGEGIRRMFEEMRLSRLTDPSYVEGDRHVTLILSATPVDEELEARLPTSTRKIVRHLREHGRASTGDLIEVTDLSRPTLRNELQQLRSEGIVEWVGTAPRDPRAYWRLPNE